MPQNNTNDKKPMPPQPNQPGIGKPHEKPGGQQGNDRDRDREPQRGGQGDENPDKREPQRGGQPQPARPDSGRMDRDEDMGGS